MLEGEINLSYFCFEHLLSCDAVGFVLSLWGDEGSWALCGHNHCVPKAEGW